MIKPETLKQQPAFETIGLGAFTGTLLASGSVLLALEYELLDIPRLMGGVFVSDQTASFWLGYALFFAAGVLLLAPLLRLFWTALPGRDVGLVGALVKGAVWGGVLWVLTGLLLPLLDALNGQSDSLVEGIGFFAISRGVVGPIWLAFTAAAYSLSLALLAAMTYGIVPMNLTGWEGYKPGENQNEAIF